MESSDDKVKYPVKYPEFAARLRDARVKAGLSGSYIATAAEVSPQAYQQWEAGLTMPRGSKRQQVVADAVGETVNWLFFGVGAAGDDGQQPLARPIAKWTDGDDGDYVFVPQLQITQASDHEVTWGVDAAQIVPFAEAWALRAGINANNSAVIEMPDSSMEPRLHAGDTVVIDYTNNSKIADGKIYAISLNGDVSIKRLFKELGGGIRIVSDNHDKVQFPDKLIPPDMMGFVQVIGVAVAVIGEL